MSQRLSAACCNVHQKGPKRAEAAERVGGSGSKHASGPDQPSPTWLCWGLCSVGLGRFFNSLPLCSPCMCTLSPCVPVLQSSLLPSPTPPQPLYTLYHLFIPARSSISCRLPQALSCQRLGLLWGQRSFDTSRVSNHSVCDNHLIINLARLITYTFLSEIRSQIFCQGRATAVTDAGLDQCPKVIKIG